MFDPTGGGEEKGFANDVTFARVGCEILTKLCRFPCQRGELWAVLRHSRRRREKRKGKAISFACCIHETVFVLKRNSNCAFHPSSPKKISFHAPQNCCFLQFSRTFIFGRGKKNFPPLFVFQAHAIFLSLLLLPAVKYFSIFFLPPSLFPLFSSILAAAAFAKPREERRERLFIFCSFLCAEQNI